uniref:GRIP1 associated protein 1 n=1 Tax=Hippocampus comes TaxID=109280 RepID=A0A3Q2YJJ9_HIPCM
MSQALSEEEFHRMQAQLLELRTHNYQLSDELRKNSAELTNLRQKNVVLERDFVKAQKALNKSKKAQEVEALLSENEMLQGKLHSQEEDFRLQNSTLMAELSKLCMQIEQLEQENRHLKAEGGDADSRPSPSATSSPADEALLRLQAENATLLKKVRGLFLGSPLRAEDKGLVFKRGHLVEMYWVQSQHCMDYGLYFHWWGALILAALTVFVVCCSFQRLQAEKEVLYNDSRTKIEEINQRKEEELKLMNTRMQKLQSDLAAANQVTTELREKFQSSDKEHQLAVNALKDQVASQSAVSQEQVDNILQENDALRTNLAALEQIQTSKMQEFNLLREQQEVQAAELQQSRAEQEKLLAQRDDLDSQLQESSFANRKLLEQLTEEGQEKEKLLRELEESKKTAEKRKAMLDTMAIQLNQETSNHKEALSDLKLQHEKEVLGVRARYEKELRGLHEEKNRSEEDIRQQLRDEKARSKELESLQAKVQELHSQLQSMEETKGWFERRLNEAQCERDANQEEGKHFFTALSAACCHVRSSQAKQAEAEAVHGQVLEVQHQRDEHYCAIVKLKQEIKDTVDGQRILEKKGSAALKDLKRQLQLERKRADKLQERLQEILTNSKSRTGLEELVLSEINSPSRTQQTGDSSSVSSFSYRDMMKESQSGGQNKSGGGSPQCQRAAELSDDELGELFQRLAEVQQEKWMLEEKVKHLEVSCSSMAEDICRKSAIIETYVMDSRIAAQVDRGGLGSVLRDLVKSGDENLREMNKKLQNMLEEQLTKNMHLHKDMEVLSQELVRLSKEPAPDGNSAGSG